MPPSHSKSSIATATARLIFWKCVPPVGLPLDVGRAVRRKCVGSATVDLGIVDLGIDPTGDSPNANAVTELPETESSETEPLEIAEP